jgi:hypothetical protein
MFAAGIGHPHFQGATLEEWFDLVSHVVGALLVGDRFNSQGWRVEVLIVAFLI